ncbi:hypothetical protein A9Q84_14030 [Halobacteriovorax marinus]|uniref:Fibronectin type-III domain-containing protein n=1 Tax=Halobacteriovorax marinus TaxID=97084 RepID=A0A1Y5FEX0_9BACT|nr:hypothetical protein A9Q84_14030 [Halobacteriovorax marinus]
MNIKTLLILTFLLTLYSCKGAGGGPEFEPNNLVSVDQDNDAERERALNLAPPTVISTSVSGNKTYVAGEVISVTLQFNKRTKITNGGSPRVPINIGGVTRYANYISGSTDRSHAFIFNYTVQAGDLDHDGVQLISPWDLNGAVVRDYADKDAILTYTPPTTNALLVDTSNLSFTVTEGSITTSPNLNLNITSSIAVEMYISDGCETGGTWVPYNANPIYPIPNLNAVNTVYVAVGNSFGGRSPCRSFTVAHDTLAPNLVSGLSIAGNSSDIVSETTSWSAASDNGPSGVSHYRMAISTNNNATGIIASGGFRSIGNVLSHAIDNGSTSFLTGLTNYFTLVTAVDNAGNESSIASIGPWQLVAISPERITSMSVVNASDTNIKVGWPYPTDNGFPIVDYVIEYKEASSPTWITISDGVKTVRREDLTALTPETYYHFRVKAYNGINYGAWSPTLTAETLPTIDFITTPYSAINVGGATMNQLVSLENDNQIFYGNNSASSFNDGSQISADLDRGKTISVPANDFTVVTATKPFFIAGRLGTGSDTYKANVVWQTSAWIGKNFLFNHSRSNPMKVKVYSFTAGTVTLTKGGGAVAGGIAAIAADAGHVFNIASYGSYEISSTSFIAVFGYANGNGSQYIDPKPLLPASNDLVGVPSRTGKFSTATAGTYNVYHSDTFSQTNQTINPGTTKDISSRGTKGYYRDEALRIRATQPIVGNSYADANGSCSSPLVPVAFQKTKFALNVQAQWVSFASTNEGTITAYEPTADGLGWETPRVYNLVRNGVDNNTPTKAYETAVKLRAGTIFEGTVPFQAWYEPLNDTNAADNDETLMFGWD